MIILISGFFFLSLVLFLKVHSISQVLLTILLCIVGVSWYILSSCMCFVTMMMKMKKSCFYQSLQIKQTYFLMLSYTPLTLNDCAHFYCLNNCISLFDTTFEIYSYKKQFKDWTCPHSRKVSFLDFRSIQPCVGFSPIWSWY